MCILVWKEANEEMMNVKKVLSYSLLFVIMACGNGTDNTIDSLGNEASQRRENTEGTDDVILDIEEIISNIREHYGAINYNVKYYDKVSKVVSSADDHTMSLKGYFKDGELRKMTTRYEDDFERLIEEYYFWDNELFFVYTQLDVDYPHDELSNYQSETPGQNRYYFHNDNLIRWLDPEKEQVVASKFSSKEAQILSEVRYLRTHLD